MSDVTYRLAADTDFPALMEMYSQLNQFFYTVGYSLPHPENVGQVWLDSFRRTLGRFSQVFVAEIAGELAGFVLCRVKRLPAHMGGALVGEISDIWVDEHMRRMGIGEQLVRLALNWLMEQRVDSVEAQVLRDNEASLKMFEHIGFHLDFYVVRLLWDKYVKVD